MPRKIQIVVVCFLLSLAGCAAVEWKHRHPDVDRNSPHAMINEEKLVAGDIASTVKGFIQNRSEDASSAKAPVPWDYSTGQTIGKALFMVTPYGWATMPFSDRTGRKIAVPPGEIGIVIHRTFYRELSKRVVVVPKDFFEGGDWMIETSSQENMVNAKGDVLEINFEALEWDEVLWASLENGQEYMLDLSGTKLLDPRGQVLAGQDMKPAAIPASSNVEKDQKIVTESGHVLGRTIMIQPEKKIVVKDKTGAVVWTMYKKKK